MLEQTCRRQEIRADQLEQQLARAEEKDGRYCNGSFLWRINKFSEIHHKMRNCHSFLVYSRSFYSSVFGYRMCLRSNLYYSEGKYTVSHVLLPGVESYRWRVPWSFSSPNERGTGWLFIVALDGNNKDHCYQPERGNTKVRLHQMKIWCKSWNGREHFSETIDSLPGLAAFEKPEEDLNARGFGFQVREILLDNYYLSLYS